MTQNLMDKKPLYAEGWLSTIWRPALRVFFYTLGMGVMALLLAGALLANTLLWRVLFNAGVLSIFGALLYSDGLTRGAKEYGQSITLAQRAEAGPAPSAAERAAIYHPLKGLATAALGALPWFLLAVGLMILAQPYTYQLQDLPSWLGYYRTRADIGAPLRFYEQSSGWATVDLLRLLVRIALMPIVNVAVLVGDRAAYLLDKLSPLLVLLLPATYAIGYLGGPGAYETLQKRNEAAKRQQLKKVARKQKKARAARETSRKDNRLI